MSHTIKSLLTQGLAKAHSLYTGMVQSIAKQSAQRQRQMENQVIVDALSPKTPCSYSDHHPMAAPEYFAKHFTQRHFRQWLLRQPQHAIFNQKKTTALHTLIRNNDTQGIRHLFSHGYPMNIIEEASKLSGIGLICRMESKNPSHILQVWQKKRCNNPKNYSLFTELCENGVTVDINCLCHITTHHACDALIVHAAKYYYRHHHAVELESLMHTLRDTANLFSPIKRFNQEHITAIMKQIRNDKNHDLMQQYSSEQLSAITKLMIKKLTQHMYQQKAWWLESEQKEHPSASHSPSSAKSDAECKTVC